MSSVSLFGGGVFYSQFNFAYLYEATPRNGLAPGVAGGWSEITASSPAGRWMQVTIHNNTAAGTYLVQLGLGAINLEVPWQPVGGLGGFYAAFSGIDVSVHWTWNFPITLDPNQRISIRSAGSVGAEFITVHLGVWG